MVAGLPSASGSDAEKPVERLKLFLTTILNRWPEDQQNHFYPWSPPSIDEARKNTSTVLIGVLDSVNDIKLINKFLRKVLRHDAGVEANSQLINIIARHGWTPFGEAIKCYFDASTIETICKDVRFLSLICQAAFKTTKKELAAKAQQICRPLPNKIVEILALKVNSEIAELKTMSKSTRVELLTGLTISLLALDSNQLLETFVGQVLAYPKQFILQTVQLPVLVETGGWLRKNRKNVPDAVKKWLSDGIEKLLSLTANEPAPPTNFKRDAKLRCNCKHCKELIEFLQNATEHQHEFQMVEHKRRHLEEQIRDSLCDLDVSTIRKSRPQILVCTKNMASHQRLVKAFKDNQQHLKTLRGLKSGD